MAAAPFTPPEPVVVAAQALYKRTFGEPPVHTVAAPGRIELLGNHTDYNQGLVLAAAIDRGLAFAVAPRVDGQIELHSAAFEGRVKFPLDAIFKDAAAPWADYVKGVLRQLQARGAHFTGFNAAIASTIPPGAGLSSSAALTVATALAVRALHPYTLTATGVTVPPRRDKERMLPPLTATEKLETAKLCLAAESEYVGVQCGLLDQITALFGRAHHALEIDCQSLAIELVPLIGEVALVVCPSGVAHALAAGEYNALRRHCEEAAAALGVKSLRAVTPPMLAAHKSRLTTRQHDCAYHIVGEIQRVLHGTRALRDGDFEQFGHFMFQSHESSRDFFRNSCDELDLLFALARTHPACLGARLTGGGFGGSTVNLVRRDGVESFCRDIASGYEERIGLRTEPMLCQCADGAR